MNQTKEKKTRYLLWPALLLLLLLLAPGNIVRVQAASDQTAVQLKRVSAAMIMLTRSLIW